MIKRPVVLLMAILAIIGVSSSLPAGASDPSTPAPTYTLQEDCEYGVATLTSSLTDNRPAGSMGEVTYTYVFPGQAPGEGLEAFTLDPGENESYNTEDINYAPADPTLRPGVYTMPITASDGSVSVATFTIKPCVSTQQEDFFYRIIRTGRFKNRRFTSSVEFYPIVKSGLGVKVVKQLMPVGPLDTSSNGEVDANLGGLNVGIYLMTAELSSHGQPTKTINLGPITVARGYTQQDFHVNF